MKSLIASLTLIALALWVTTDATADGWTHRFPLVGTYIGAVSDTVNGGSKVIRFGKNVSRGVSTGDSSRSVSYAFVALEDFGTSIVTDTIFVYSSSIPDTGGLVIQGPATGITLPGIEGGIDSIRCSGAFKYSWIGMR